MNKYTLKFSSATMEEEYFDSYAYPIKFRFVAKYLLSASVLGLSVSIAFII